MKFTITSTITYDVDDQFFNDFLQKENATMEDYKKEASNSINEMWKSEIGTEDTIENLTINTDMQVS